MLKTNSLNNIQSASASGRTALILIKVGQSDRDISKLDGRCSINSSTALGFQKLVFPYNPFIRLYSKIKKLIYLPVVDNVRAAVQHNLVPRRRLCGGVVSGSGQKPWNRNPGDRSGRSRPCVTARGTRRSGTFS